MNNKKLSVVELEQILTEVQLPALPQSAVSILKISQDPKNGPAEFAVAIEADPGLTGQVLRFVNSSYFGFSHEISSIKLAITLVGVRTIKNFSLWNAVFSLMPKPKNGSLDLNILWQDSLRRALFARALSKQLGIKECEEVFAAALLQDMAIPLLVKELPERYAELFDALEADRRLSDIEQEVFGWTHAEVAGIMAREWNLPDDFAELLEGHTQIDRWVDGNEKHSGKMIVAFSALLPSAADEQWNDLKRCESIYSRTMIIGGPKFAELLERTDEEFSEFSPLLNIAVPKRPLLDFYEQLTNRC